MDVIWLLLHDIPHVTEVNLSKNDDCEGTKQLTHSNSRISSTSTSMLHDAC